MFERFLLRQATRKFPFFLASFCSSFNRSLLKDTLLTKSLDLGVRAMLLACSYVLRCSCASVCCLRSAPLKSKRILLSFCSSFRYTLRKAETFLANFSCLPADTLLFAICVIDTADFLRFMSTRGGGTLKIDLGFTPYKLSQSISATALFVLLLLLQRCDSLTAGNVMESTHACVRVELVVWGFCTGGCMVRLILTRMRSEWLLGKSRPASFRSRIDNTCISNSGASSDNRGDTR